MPEADDLIRGFDLIPTVALWRFGIETPIDTSEPAEAQVDQIFDRARLLHCNDATARFFGRDHASALAGARLRDLLPDGEKTRDFLRRFVTSRYALTNEESHETGADGRLQIFVTHLGGTFDGGRRLTGICGAHIDVSSQREQEILLRQSHERLERALGAAGMYTWSHDLRNGTSRCDEVLSQHFGLPENGSGTVQALLADRIHPDDRDRVLEAVDRALRQGTDYSEEMRVHAPDGGVRWILDRGRVVPGPDGGAGVFAGAMMDITEQRRVEEYERLLGQTAEALASSADCDRTLADVTRALAGRFADACAVHFVHDTGVRLVSAAGNDAFRPDERRIAQVARDGGARAQEHEIVLPLRAGGQVFGAMSFASDPDGRPFDADDRTFATMIADRVALAIDHARLFRELQEASRLKDEFLATLSHELRTPLNAVLGWTRMLRSGSVSPDRADRVLETIERNAAAQMQLVEELLDLSAMVAGGLRLNVTRVDLRELIGGAVETIRPAADAKSQRLTVTIDPELDEIAADPGRLRQVLWNLLANAVKFTPPGGAIELTAAQGPADVEITVRDSGQGIAREFLAHVFEAFRQADASSSRMVGGLGLGLAIVRHIVEAHGGSVSVQSDGAERGSTFAVRLPASRPGARRQDSELAWLRGRRVLAVDDDESTQELVATMLLMYGVSVRTAGRAAQAFEILSAWHPDVLLADLAMPGEDGYALVRRVRAMPPPLGLIPAVALTAYTDPRSVQHAFAAGFDAHLGKPLEPHVLADALVKVLRARGRR